MKKQSFKIDYIVSILLILFLSTSLFSCGNDEPKSSIPATQNVYVGSHFNIGDDGNWVSSNKFVATVEDGFVKGVHVGECVISNGKQICIITVIPTSHFIEEPTIEWGISKDQIISKYGDDYTSSREIIGYLTNYPETTPLVMFGFINNWLSASAILVSTKYTDQMVDFLIERYQPIKMDGYDSYFVNGYTPESTTLATKVSLLNDDYWNVIYVPYSSSRLSSEYIDHEDLFGLIHQINGL